MYFHVCLDIFYVGSDICLGFGGVQGFVCYFNLLYDWLILKIAWMINLVIYGYLLYASTPMVVSVQVCLLYGS